MSRFKFPAVKVTSCRTCPFMFMDYREEIACGAQAYLRDTYLIETGPGDGEQSYGNGESVPVNCPMREYDIVLEFPDEVHSMQEKV